MKAIVNTQYGSPDVMQYQDVEKPTPQANEVLVKLHTAAVNAGDWHLLRGTPLPVRLMYGLRKPNSTILGAAGAGVVEAVGNAVIAFKPGDAVFGDFANCGFGAFAEYVTVPEDVLAPKPADITFEQAVALPSAAVTALQALRDKGQIKAGQRVLINGASGGVGTYAVQLAKIFGAHITAVASTRKLDAVRALGADEVIDYTKENFTQNGQQYDLIHAANGYHPIADYARSLAPGGSYVMTGGKDAQFYQALLLGPWFSMMGNKKMGNMLVKPNKDDLVFLANLVEEGKLLPVIDQCYSLQEVPEAVRYLEEGRARGKVIIQIV